MEKLLLLLYPTFSEFEIGVALSLVRRRYEVVTFARTGQPVESEGGLRCLPHLAVEEADPQEHAGLIIPGGLDMVHLEDAPQLYSLVRAMYEAGRPVAAICGGPFALGRAGLLAEHRYTASFTQEQREFLGLPEERYAAEAVVRSGNLLTAQGSAYVDFGLELAQMLAVFADEAEAAAAAAFFHHRLEI